jgi:cellobiose phosphorylase
MNNFQFMVKKRDMEASGSSLKTINDSFMKPNKSYGVLASNLNQSTGMIHCLVVCEANRLMSFSCDVLEFAAEEIKVSTEQIKTQEPKKSSKNEQPVA